MSSSSKCHLGYFFSCLCLKWVLHCGEGQPVLTQYVNKMSVSSWHCFQLIQAVHFPWFSSKYSHISVRQPFTGFCQRPCIHIKLNCGSFKVTIAQNHTVFLICTLLALMYCAVLWDTRAYSMIPLFSWYSYRADMSYELQTATVPLGPLQLQYLSGQIVEHVK